MTSVLSPSRAVPMTAINEAVGLMNPAYFVGRAELLNWLNTLLNLRLTRVEESCSGAVACQVMDTLFPGKVQMHRVNWGARTEAEYVCNYKILQATCEKVGVDRKIEVERLIKGRVQDNLEFLQWLHRFYENNVGTYNPDHASYDAVGRRAVGKLMGAMKWVNVSGVSAPAAPKVAAVTLGNYGSVRPAASRIATKAAPVAAATVNASEGKENYENVIAGLRAELEAEKSAHAATRGTLEDYRTQLMAFARDLEEANSKCRRVDAAIETALNGEEGDQARLLAEAIAQVLSGLEQTTYVADEEEDLVLDEIPAEEEA